MKAKILANDSDLIVMFRLGSIEGEMIENVDDAREKFISSINDQNLAVLILTKSIKSLIETEVNEHQQSEKTPLIVVIDG